MVLYFTNRPTPYRLPLYAALREGLVSIGAELHIFFLGYARRDRSWQMPPEEEWGFEHSYGNGSSRSIAGPVAAIRRMKPDAVVLAWAMDLVALRLLLYCRRRGIPCLVVSGETERSAAGNSYPALRRFFRLPFFRLASGFVTYGTASAEYLVRSGVPASRVHTGINTVDTESFRRRTEGLREDGSARELRERYRDPDGHPFACHFLFVGYLLRWKGILQGVEAMAHAVRSDGAGQSDGGSGIALHIVGAGELEEELRRRVEELGLSDRLFFHGYRQQEELPLYYAMADVLLFPSLDEVFGLVMAEGAAAGLPIIASRWAGGTRDIVKDGANGIVIDPNDIGEFARAINRLAGDPELRARMGEASRRHAAEHLSIRQSGRRYLEALRPYLS